MDRIGIAEVINLQRMLGLRANEAISPASLTMFARDRFAEAQVPGVPHTDRDGQVFSSV
jgi:hypothetical protein